jgi:hypothetical protein
MAEEGLRRLQGQRKSVDYKGGIESQKAALPAVWSTRLFPAIRVEITASQL